MTMTLSGPATRIISFTVTEAGYYLDAKDQLDQSFADLRADLEAIKAGRAGSTIYGALTRILRTRMQGCGAPVTLLNCVDLETGKYWLDVLAMITEKTKGNLHPKESRLLEGILADLRMQYVTMVRATEEKLKAQAAKQFSDADILGKK